MQFAMSSTTNNIGRFMIAVGCVMEHRSSGRILCLKRDRSDWLKAEWELLYGRVDQHEELVEALRREVAEETGITDFEVKRLLRVWHLYRGEQRAENELYGLTFHCVVESDCVKISSEHSEYRWLDPAEALELIRVEGVREDIRQFMTGAQLPKVSNQRLESVLN